MCELLFDIIRLSGRDGVSCERVEAENAFVVFAQHIDYPGRFGRVYIESAHRHYFIGV